MIDNVLNKIPTREEFLRGITEYEKHEPRDAMYKVAERYLSQFWNNPSDITDGLGILLLTWNQAFYRYGSFDFNILERCITSNIDKINSFRNRNIYSLSEQDENSIKILFLEFLDTLQISSGRVKEKKSPVGVAKALHLLAPYFFPLWDDKIARSYGCYYNKNPEEKYVLFSKLMKVLAEKVKNYDTRRDRTIVKLIDEYNYSKYTRKWI